MSTVTVSGHYSGNVDGRPEDGDLLRNVPEGVIVSSLSCGDMVDREQDFTRLSLSLVFEGKQCIEDACSAIQTVFRSAVKVASQYGDVEVVGGNSNVVTVNISNNAGLDKEAISNQLRAALSEVVNAQIDTPHVQTVKPALYGEFA